MTELLFERYLGDFWIVKTDASGNLQWEKNFGGSSFESLNSLQQTSDNNYILGGCSNSIDQDVSGNNGNENFWIVKVLNDTINTCNSKPQVTAETGDFYSDHPCYGLVLTAPDGSCYRIKIDVGGNLIIESVLCP